MIKEIGSFKFPGFYESLYCNSDEFIDDEEEVKYEIEQYLSDDDKFSVEYEYINFTEYKIDVCKIYLEYYLMKIIDVLPDKIVDNPEFKLIQIEEDTRVISPQYYNYVTDRCFCNVETNRFTLQQIKDYTLNIPEAPEYIRDHFSSCDGFISFLPNDIEVWKDTDIEEYEENMLIALMDMLIYLKDCTGFNDIYIETYYEVDKYYYAEPVIYCQSSVANKIDKHCNKYAIKVIE